LTRYILTVEFEPDKTPGIIRLRRWLKTLWRAYKVRVVSISEQRNTVVDKRLD
jgi:hypothetical protein